MEFLQYFALICVLCFAEAKYLHLDYQYDEDAKIWLKLHNLKTNWHQARKMCNMEGAILASPLDETLKYALDTYSKAYGIDRYYVGIHATFSRQIWHSIEGIPLENLVDHLDINQMESSNYKSCSVMEAGSLMNVDCSEMFPYICYKKENVSRELTSCGTTDIAYQLDERTGNCYKFHAEARTWVEAYETCFAEQAYLVIINSNTEAQILIDIFENHPSSTLHADHPNVMNIGVIDWEHNRDWYTIHGERIQDAGFSLWSNGEPNNADRIEYCGSIFRNGLLNDEPCSKKNVFVCEKDVRFVHTQSTTEYLDTTASTPTENPYTTITTLSENLHTTESSSSKYTTESEYNDDGYTSESDSSKNTYTTESTSSKYTTKSEYNDNVYTTESNSSEKIYTTETTSSKYAADSENNEKNSTTDLELLEKMFIERYLQTISKTITMPTGYVPTELAIPEIISEHEFPQRPIIVDNDVVNSERPYTTHKMFTDTFNYMTDFNS